jgi:hypothetical protein
MRLSTISGLSGSNDTKDVTWEDDDPPIAAADMMNECRWRPEMPSLRTIVHQYRARHHNHRPPSDDRNADGAAATTTELMALLPDVDAIIESVEEGVHQLLQQIAESRYRCAHFVQRHRLAHDPRMIELIATHVYSLTTNTEEGACAASGDDQRISDLLAHEGQGLSRAVSSLPHFIAEFFFASAAVEFLSKNAVETPLQLQFDVWQQGQMFAEWETVLRHGASFLRKAAEVVDDHRVFVDMRCGDAHDGLPATQQDVLARRNETLEALLLNGAIVQEGEAIGQDTIHCLYRTLSETIFCGTMTSAWISQRGLWHKQDVTAQEGPAQHVVPPDEAVARYADADWVKSITPILHNSSVMDYLLALESFVEVSEEVATVCCVAAPGSKQKDSS